MDELTALRLFGGFGTGIDLACLVAFFAIAVIYLIIPVIGYENRRPAQLAASLYLLIGYAVITLLQQLMEYIHFLDGTGVGRNDSFQVHLVFGFAVVKTLLFVIALITFVIGLQSLWLKKNEAETP